MRKIRLLFFSLLIFYFPMCFAASKFAGRWYQVEMIIFSHLTSKGLDSEQWPLLGQEMTLPDTLINLIPPNSFQSAEQFKLLGRQGFTLQKEQRYLAHRSGYNVLMHLAWKQQVWMAAKSKPIHIFGGAVYDSDGQRIGTDVYGDMSYNPNIIWEVNGTMTLSVQHYLDAQFNLLFAVPIPQVQTLSRNDYFSNAPGNFVYFRFLQNRRMRSQELNYISHPLFGVLIKILPLDENGQPIAKKEGKK